MSAPIPSAIGKASEGRKISAQVASDKLKNESIIQHETGLTGANRQLNENENEGKPMSYFDMAPHAVQVDAGDEAMRDLVSLQPHFGQDKLMGQREWDPSLLDYLASKRQRVVQQSYDDLLMAVHDPLDPQQRRRLESLLPNLTRSKQEVFAAVTEQRTFLENMAIKLESSREEMARLVRILGGGEMILQHPLDRAFAEGTMYERTNATADLEYAAKGFAMIPGLFGFATTAYAKREDPKGRKLASEGSKNMRIRLASYVLHHFPRMLTGAYNPLASDPTDERARKPRADAAKKVVQMCEEMIKGMIPLGNVAEKYLADGDYRDRAQRVERNRFNNFFASPSLND